MAEDKIRPSSATYKELRVNIINKKWIEYILIISIIIVGIAALFPLVSYVIVQAIIPEPTIMQTAVSPDGKYTAYVFEWNAGATSGFVYRLSILESNKKLGKGWGNTYISEYEFDVKWIDNKTLQVINGGDEGTRHETLVNGIKVKYGGLHE